MKLFYLQMCAFGEEHINKLTSEESTDIRIDGRENNAETTLLHSFQSENYFIPIYWPQHHSANIFQRVSSVFISYHSQCV